MAFFPAAGARFLRGDFLRVSAAGLRLPAVSVGGCGGVSAALLTFTTDFFWLMFFGGLGGLGLRAASSLIARGAACVLLASRSGRVVRDGQGLDGQLRSFGNASKVVACDASDSGDVEALVGLQDICSGILHAAGVLRDVLIRSMSNESVQLVLSSKAGGASMMDRATACVPVAAFGLFSSVASTFGNVGQGNYASANAYLDALALHPLESDRWFELADSSRPWGWYGSVNV